MPTILTADAIREMPAGPRLSALIAEHVMGWREKRVDGDYLAWVRANGDIVCYCGAEPPFSSDPAAAWSVVEWLQSRGWSITLNLHYDDDFPVVADIRCPFSPCERHGNTSGDWHGFEGIEGDTMPLAVCRAALLATLRG